MDFRLSEEQELLLESVREMMKGCSESYISDCDRNHEYPIEFKKMMVENGFNLLGVPEEYGGTPVDTLTLMLVNQELAKLGAPSYLIGDAMRIDDMIAFGGEEHRRITMELSMQGKIAFCLGISEPQAGSDNNAMTCSATRRNGKVYINGNKSFISHANLAPYMLTLTKDQETNKVSMWWLPLDAPGVKIAPLTKIGWNMTKTCEVYLNDVALEEKDLVGEEGKGFFQLMKNFEIERLQLCAVNLGMAEGAFEDVARYANQRVQFGQKIGSFQLTQEKICQMKIKIENMKRYIYQTCWEKDNGISIKISSSLCKLYCAQASFEVIDDALQILGGIGYAGDHRVARFWRDSRCARIGGGTDEIMIYIAGKGLLKEYSK